MATKIKDGLFIGDAESSQDPEFMELNKITFVINCAGRQLPNLWEMHGLHYLTFPWASESDCILFDGGNVVIEQITSFIDEALAKGDSVLVHSLDGTGRCIACVTAYLMLRHRWGFEKSLEFVCSKRPDAAPIPSFIRQLYQLDLRLCAKWFGPGMEPPENDRMRHDQWVPLSPISLRKLDQQQSSLADRNTSRRRDSITTSGGIVNSRDSAKNKDFGCSVTGDLSLSGVSEVKEEEMVLVNSFLNSQPQISSLPVGQKDYEDHVPKKLHWIDRPRMTKLAAVGRSSSDKRKPLLVPVSPGPGRPVPERPANSSYNAISREGKLSTKKSSMVVGILKKKGSHLKADSAGGDKNRAEPQSSVSAKSESQIDCSVNGGGAAAGPMGEGRREETAQGRMKEVRGLEGRNPARARVSDEVVVEDLSEKRLDPRSCATIAHGGDASMSRRGDNDWRKEKPVRRLVQVDENERLSLENSVPLTAGASGHNSSLSEHPPDAPTTQGTQAQHTSSARRLSTDKLVPSASDYAQTNSQVPVRTTFGRKQEVSAALETRGKAGSRQGDRQAWDGETGPETEKGGTRSHGRRSHSDCYGELGSLDLSASGGDKNDAPHYAPTAPSSTQPLGRAIGSGDPVGATTSTKSSAGQRRPGVKEAQQRDAVLNGYENHDNGVCRGVNKSTVINSTTRKATQARRVGSEGNLKFPSAEIASYMPQAPGMKTSLIPTTTNAASPPECKDWNPGDRRRETMSVNRQGGGTGESLEDVYLVGTSGASLQQLAQTPNPQQRRLPSPRPQSDFHQGGRAQGPSDVSQLLPQNKRPTSAPSQRPDVLQSSKDPAGIWVNGPASKHESAEVTSGGSSSGHVGATNHGYPVHGLMPSGSTVQLHDQPDPSRWGAAGGSDFRPRPLQMPVATVANGGSGGKTGGSSGHRAVSVTSSPMSGGSYSSTESLRLARVSSNASVDVESRPAGGHPAGKERRSNGGGPRLREIRNSRPGASRSKDISRSQGAGPSGSPASNTSSTNVGSDPRSVKVTTGGWRGLGSGGGVPAYQIHSSLVRPTVGTLPRPSKRSSAENGRRSESDRWANPAPRGRQGPVAISGATSFSYAGAMNGTDRAAGNEGEGSKVAGLADSSQNPADNYSPSLSSRPQAVQRGSGSRSSAGGAPRYRAGSPAPTRGRRSGTAAAPVSGASMGTGYARHAQGSGMSSAFRGYGTSTTGAGSGGASGGSSRRSPSSSPAAVRDRHKRTHRSYDRNNHAYNSSSMRRTHDVPHAGQRPSTSEGLPSGGSGGGAGPGGGRRGRSPNPAPRPSSASSRRQSSSPAPAAKGLGTSFIREAHRMGVPIDSGIDRPRWK